MTEGSVILVRLPQADGRLKTRPALVLRLMAPFGDLLICGISTQLNQQVAGFDEIVSASDADFAFMGLDGTSLIRLGFLTSQPRRGVAGVIGAVSAERHQRLLRRLSAYLVERLQP